MGRMQRSLERIVFGGSILLAVIAMIPLCYAAFSAFPSADDFVYALKTHGEWERSGSLAHVMVDALRYAGQIFRTWQGTFFGALVMSLGPAAFSWRLYPLHVFGLLGLSLCASLLLLRALSRKVYGMQGFAYIPAAFWLWALMWMGMPDLLEGLYWYNSAWFYTGGQMLCYLALALALCLRTATGKWRLPGWGLFYVLMPCIGLNNYVSAVWMFCVLGVLTVFSIRETPGAGIRLGVGCLVLLLCLLVSVLAPGNAVRLAADDQQGLSGLGVGGALLTAFGQSFRLLGRHLFGTPLWLMALLMLMWGAAREHPAGFSGKKALLLPLVCWSILVAMLFPHLYTSGTIGPTRIVNLYAQWIALSSLGCAYVLGGGLGRLLHGRRVSRRAARVAGIGGALLVLCLLVFGQPSSYRGLLQDTRSGEIAAYRMETRQAFEALQAASGQASVLVPPPSVTPAAVASGWLSSDPALWKNEAVATYFDIGSVRMTKEKE